MLARMRPVVSRPSAAARRPATVAARRSSRPRRASAAASRRRRCRPPRAGSSSRWSPTRSTTWGWRRRWPSTGKDCPTISYFGFPAQLEEGEIPVARPVGSPFLRPRTATTPARCCWRRSTPDQIWTRGRDRAAEGDARRGARAVRARRRAVARQPDAGERRRGPTSRSRAPTSTPSGPPTRRLVRARPAVRDRRRGGDAGGGRALDRGRRRRRTDRRLHDRRGPSRRCGSPSGSARTLEDHHGGDPPGLRRGMSALNAARAPRRRTARGRTPTRVSGERDRGTAAGRSLDDRGGRDRVPRAARRSPPRATRPAIAFYTGRGWRSRPADSARGRSRTSPRS